jgi:hypothetical protein
MVQCINLATFTAFQVAQVKGHIATSIPLRRIRDRTPKNIPGKVITAQGCHYGWRDRQIKELSNQSQYLSPDLSAEL